MLDTPTRARRAALTLLAATGLLLAAPTLAQARTPGQVVHAEPYHARWVPSRAAQAYKLTYVTSDLLQRPALSTGLIYLPAGQPPAGGWPVVSWAHGTQGVADACAPSVSGPYQPERDGRYLDQYLAQGYAVVASDYQGLGSVGEHAYLHGPTAARNIIDMVKASRTYTAGLPAAQQLSHRWVSVGHSQGAGAAVMAGHLATDLGGPSLDFRGTFGTGTPVAVDLTALVMQPGNLSANAGAVNAYHAYLLLGLLQVEPGIDRVLSDAGRQRLAQARQLCLGELSAALEGASTGAMFRAPLLSVPGLAPKLRSYFGMPLRGFDRPLLMAHGVHDRDVVYLNTLLYAAGLALNRQPVAFRSYGTDHWGILDAASSDGLQFVNARFAAPRGASFDASTQASEALRLQRQLDQAGR